MLNLNSFLLYSENPQALADFYKQVIGSDPVMEQDNYSTFKGGDCYITIGPHDKVSGKSPNPERIMFNFETKEVEEEFERIKAIEGVAVIAEPYKMDPSMVGFIATLADPDGNIFQLMTPFEDMKAG